LGQKKDLKNVNVRLIGVVWDVESEPYHRLLRVCSERVVKRGDNHQTLRPDLTLEAEHEAVVGNFLRNWTSPDPEIFEKLITVNIPDPISVTFRTIVESLCQTLDIPLPRDEKIEQALKDAEAYKVTTPYRAPAVKIGKKVRYFGVAPEIDLKSTVLSIFDTRSDNEAQSMFENMQKDSRVTTKPHITLVHENSVASEKEAAGEAEAEATGPVQGLWGTCRGLAESTLSPIYEFDMPYLVWDGRVMALMVDNLHPRTITPGPTDKKDGEAGTAKAPELIISDELSVFLHVTVGTKSEATNAFEARALVKAARQAIASGTKESSTDEIAEGGGRVKWLKLDNVKGEGRIRGMY
jgi:tRNA ligase